jgi:outer membrane biosynthesis protein TonB
VFDEEKHSFGKFFRENRVGIYTTVSVHLLAIILLLLYRLQDLGKIEIPFILDFSQQEAKEVQLQKQERRKQFEKELDDILTPTRHHTLRNVAVDETEQVLRDDRHKNPSDIYDEAQRVQERLDASRQALQQQQGGDEVLRPAGTDAAASESSAETYKGPSVLSYNLDGRKAMRLPIPVYQCRGSGDVTVRIEVDRGGYVVNTTIDTAASTGNACLTEAAKRAAKTSRFATSDKAPARQQGHIVYRFIAQ